MAFGRGLIDEYRHGWLCFHVRLPSTSNQCLGHLHRPARSTRRHSVGLLTVRLLVLTPAEVNHFSQMAPRAAVKKLASSLRGRIASR